MTGLEVVATLAGSVAAVTGNWITMDDGDGFQESVAPDVWVPGQTRVTVQAVCCPACGGLEVGRRGAARQGEASEWWECKACRKRWKEPAGPQIGRVNAVE